MAQKLIRGRLLSFKAEPRSIDDHNAYLFEEDGAVLVEDGVILASGSFAEVAAGAEAGHAVV